MMIPPSPPPSPPVDFNFNFDSTTTSPFISAPGSPQPFVNNPLFFSAPASPTRISAFYSNIDEFYAAATNGCDSINTGNDDFEFDFSGQLDIISVSAADELFDCGKIKPFKLHSNEPKSPIAKNIKDSAEPISSSSSAAAAAAAIVPENQETEKRGRGERKCKTRKGSSRSLSPFRVFDIFSDHEDTKEQQQSQSQSSSLISKWGWKGWKLKDLLLFRSASEGRASDKSSSPMMMMKKYDQLDAKNSSFRSTESGSGSVSRGRRRGPASASAASAHEIHYTANRAASEEMKRRTSLPYRHGLMGCLGFNPVLRDHISRRFESMTRG